MNNIKSLFAAQWSCSNSYETGCAFVPKQHHQLCVVWAFGRQMRSTCCYAFNWKMVPCLSKFLHASHIELPMKRKKSKTKLEAILLNLNECYSVELLDCRMPAWKWTSVSLLHQGLQSEPPPHYSTLLSRRLIKLITGLWAFQLTQGKISMCKMRHLNQK